MLNMAWGGGTTLNPTTIYKSVRNTSAKGVTINVTPNKTYSVIYQNGEASPDTAITTINWGDDVEVMYHDTTTKDRWQDTWITVTIYIIKPTINEIVLNSLNNIYGVIITQLD